MLLKNISPIKSFIGCLALLLCLTSNLEGQESRFQAGIEIGLSTSQVSGDALAGYNKFGASAGPYVRIKFNDKISSRLGFLFINKGSRKNANPKSGDLYTYALRLNYVEVPILFNYELFDFLRLEGGIGIGRLIKSLEVDNGFERNIRDPFNNFEFAFLAGAQYQLNEKFHVTGRFSQSILPIRNEPPTGNTFRFYDAGNYNSVLQLMLGYQF